MMQRQPYCTRMPNTHQLIGGEETEETITLLTLLEETITSPCLDKKNTNLTIFSPLFTEKRNVESIKEFLLLFS